MHRRKLGALAAAVVVALVFALPVLAQFGGGPFGGSAGGLARSAVCLLQGGADCNMTGEFRTTVGTFKSAVASGGTAYTYDTNNTFSAGNLACWKEAGGACTASIDHSGTFTGNWVVASGAFQGNTWQFSNASQFVSGSTNREFRGADNATAAAATTTLRAGQGSTGNNGGDLYLKGGLGAAAAQAGGSVFVQTAPAAAGTTLATRMEVQPDGDTGIGDSDGFGGRMTWVQANGLAYFGCGLGGCARFYANPANDSTAFEVSNRHIAVQGAIHYKERAFGICNSSREGQVQNAGEGGGTNRGARTRLCLCTSDGAASPTYAWQNIVTGNVGTTTTCPA